jgi:hypothetical protein
VSEFSKGDWAKMRAFCGWRAARPAIGAAVIFWRVDCMFI